MNNIYEILPFSIFIVFLMVFDLCFVNNSKSGKVDVNKNIKMCIFYFVLACLFGLWVLYSRGFTSFTEYMTGFLVEQTLSIDNIFLMSAIFSSLSIPTKYQHRVLFWGILGVIVFRAIMIILGIKLIEQYVWILDIFAVIMILMGFKMLFIKESNHDIENNKILKLLQKYFNITKDLKGEKFIVIQKDENNKSKIFITPLMVALIFIEVTDIIFAIDSIPAIFTITTDIYIIYTSNIFAILGLRSLYFVLSNAVNKFKYIKYSIAFILIFIGAKIFVKEWLKSDFITPGLSLVVTVALLLSGVLYSIYRNKLDEKNNTQ